VPNSTQQNAFNGAQSTGVGVIYDQLGNPRVTGAMMTAGVAAGNVLASDASGNLTLQANPVLAATNTFTGVNTFSQSVTIPEGSNAYMGTVAVAGTVAVTVATTAVSAKSRIFLTTQVPAGTVGSSYVSATSTATSFQVQSTSAGDTSTVAWLIINHT
jgi:hypothetical protein